MIIDLKKFIVAEQPYWNELERALQRHDQDPYRPMPFDEIRRLHYLYQRAAADLSKINTFSAEQGVRGYLESMVGRAYGVIHGAQRPPVRFSPVQWLWRDFPRAFRRRWKAFVLSLIIMSAGGVFGGAAIVIDPEAKTVLMPFEHLQMDPAERVAKEESPTEKDRLRGAKGRFSAFLMTHNTRISILVLALGMTWGVGTVLLLFTNGVMLGAVVADYVWAGHSEFLLGWLLPHGAVEIPSILIAGQAGLLLAEALLGLSSDKSMGERLRAVVPDVVNLITGVAVMLIWAGLVEAFFSQYHEPVIPYAFKIAFGVLEIGLLVFFLRFAGQRESGLSKRGASFRWGRKATHHVPTTH
jgi:uncharacterized membrane protein SpoIIM required for sporulation